MKPDAALLDTSFFIRLLDVKDPLCRVASGYFDYFRKQQVAMYLSTITIAEYTVRGEIDELPLRLVRILPFNVNHGIKAGWFARTIYDKKQTLPGRVERIIIPNDTKLFAQADEEAAISMYVTADGRSEIVYNGLSPETAPRFRFINIQTTLHTEAFGLLPFGD